MPLSELGASLTWRRLGVLLRQLPREARTVRALGHPSVEWSTEAHLLALCVDNLAAANWQRAGDKRAPRPQPVTRPGETPRATSLGTPMPLNELRRRLHPEEFTDGS